MVGLNASAVAPGAALFGLLVVPPLNRVPASIGYRDSLPGFILSVENLLIRWHRWVDRNWTGRLFVTERLVYSETKFFGTPVGLRAPGLHGGSSGGQWWTPVTYMFVHGSYSHLLSNLLSLGLSGFSACQRVGAGATLGFFLSGGVFAALNSSARAIQFERRIGRMFTWPVGYLARLEVPGQVRDAVADAATRVSKGVSGRLSEALSPHQRLAGCSAGVMSLTGVSLACGLEDVLSNAYWGRPNAGAMFSLLINGVQVFFMIHGDYVSLLAGGSGSGGNSSIDHAGHLSGFAWGFLVYGAMRIGSLVIAKRNDEHSRNRSRHWK